MPHEVPGVFHMLLRHGRGFSLSDLEEAAEATRANSLEWAATAHRGTLVQGNSARLMQPLKRQCPNLVQLPNRLAVSSVV